MISSTSWPSGDLLTLYLSISWYKPYNIYHLFYFLIHNKYVCFSFYRSNGHCHYEIGLQMNTRILSPNFSKTENKINRFSTPPTSIPMIAHQVLAVQRRRMYQHLLLRTMRVQPLHFQQRSMVLIGMNHQRLRVQIHCPKSLAHHFISLR